MSRAATVITLVGGTMFLMWIGEQITARGIGNGISLIIFVGSAQLPAELRFDGDGVRRAEAAALARLLSDRAVLERCQAVCGGDGVGALPPPLRREHDARSCEPALGGRGSRDARDAAGRDEQQEEQPEQQQEELLLELGLLLERVVKHYAAPHLRPTAIAQRKADEEAEAGDDGGGGGRPEVAGRWCWSLRALLGYCAALR